MISRCLRFVAGFPLVLLLPAVWLAGCEERNVFQPPPPPKVTVATPVERSVADTIEFTGTLQATAQVDLRARVDGYLLEIAFQDGATVAKGDLLFVIEKAPFEIAHNSAQAKLEKAEANLKLEQAQFNRLSKLAERNAVTQAELDVQKAELASARADRGAARSALKQAELDLSYTEIRAPIGGRIGRHLVDVGNLVQAEQTLLATIESIDPIHAYFNVSETDLLRFMEMLRRNELPDPDEHPPTLQLGLSNESGFPHTGQLDFREFGVDPSTGTVLRRAVFPNPNGELIPGLFVRIRAQVGQPVPRLLVDERAIGADQRGEFLLVVNDENVVEYRTVRLGIRVGTLRTVLEGIDKDDRVVINGLQRARPGATVDPQPGEMLTDEEPEGKQLPPKEGEDSPAESLGPAKPEPAKPEPATPEPAKPEPSSPESESP